MLSEVIKAGDPNYWVGKSSLQRVTNLKCAVNLAIKLIKAFSFQSEPEPVRTGLGAAEGEQSFPPIFLWSCSPCQLSCIWLLSLQRSQHYGWGGCGSSAFPSFMTSGEWEEKQKLRGRTGCSAWEATEPSRNSLEKMPLDTPETVFIGSEWKPRLLRLWWLRKRRLHWAGWAEAELRQRGAD